ncbi:helix-turn-helix transcriptional regulator [Streptomyces sp. NPDC048659]|uniref:helix-turn-helix domain-containing protein n=1 Tax=Streptomyces sp. NPDC048659 TaxID=3155489 RepID=UPI0034387E76
MAARKEIDGSAGVPQFYGKELRYKREEAGLTLKRLVEGSFYGITYLSEIERGERSMPLDLARHVDRELKTDGFFERRCDEARQARLKGHAPYFERVLEAEKRATTIEEWAPTVIPGLLQTAPYMRALFKGEWTQELPEEIDEKITGRLARARLFDQDHKEPEYKVILHESLVRLPVMAGPQMAAQLDQIIALIKRGRVFAQILPWSAGAHPLMLNNAMILDFTDAPPLVYMEGQHHGNTVDDPALVKQYRRSYDLLRAAAMPLDASLALIESAAEGYRNGKQPDRSERRDLA